MIDTSKAVAAQQAAEQAAQAAQAAQDGAEIEFLGTVTNVKQIAEGRNTHDANRLKSRYISVFGFEKWQRLVADSRR
ncbi:MAG: hypothetical protein ACJ72H_28615 [Candidatus Sulfotelmatobacter sp.]